MHPVGREVEPHDLGPHLGLGRHLQRQTAPARQHLVIERRGMARDHHLAGQILEQVQERDMVDLS